MIAANTTVTPSPSAIFNMAAIVPLALYESGLKLKT
jgi:hypothetical protein